MKRQNGNMDRKGFTLIELLIVVAIIGILAAIAVGGGSGGGASLYGYFNSKDVGGHLESVTSAMPPGSIVSPGVGSVFQASVAIKKDDASYVTFSTEDRQWAAFEGDKAKGKCVEARVFPYAPWSLSKAGTYYGGRLLSVKDCQ